MVSKENSFQIFIVPNFEIEIEDKGISPSHEKMGVLREMEKFKEIVFFSPEKFVKKTNIYLNLILDCIRELKLFISVKHIEDFEVKPFSRNFTLSSPYCNVEKTIELEKTQNFSEQLFDYFISNTQNLRKIKINIVIDNFEEVPKEITEYIEFLQKHQLYEINNIIYYRTLE